MEVSNKMSNTKNLLIPLDIARDSGMISPTFPIYRKHWGSNAAGQNQDV
jgi:hypothetical protein